MRQYYQNSQYRQEKNQRNLEAQQTIFEKIKLCSKIQNETSMKAKAINNLQIETKKKLAIDFFKAVAPLNNSDLSVLNYIRFLRNSYPYVNPAQLTIAIKNGYSRKTINKSIKKLVDNGLLIKIVVRHGATLFYVLNPLFYLREAEEILSGILPAFKWFNKSNKNDISSLVSCTSYYSTTPQVIHKKVTHNINRYLYNNLSIGNQVKSTYNRKSDENLEPRNNNCGGFNMKNNNIFKKIDNLEQKEDLVLKGVSTIRENPKDLNENQLSKFVSELNKGVINEISNKKRFLAFPSYKVLEAEKTIQKMEQSAPNYMFVAVSCIEIPKMLLQRQCENNGIKYYLYKRQ